MKTKTCILGLMLLGLSTLTFSQNELAFNFKSLDIPSETLKANNNSTKESKQISKRITSFQQVASNFDITTNAVYKPNIAATYTVVFKEANNVIENLYSTDGKVISSTQKFEDIRLPNVIIGDILKEYPGWSIKAADCNISYNKDSGTLVLYKIKIKNGAKSKTIKVVR